MKNYQILELSEKLNQYGQQLKSLKGAKFAYTIVKNVGLLSEEFKTMSSLIEQSDRYKEYESKRVDLCEQFCKKDDTGNLQKRDLGNNRFEYMIDMESADWKNAITSLQEEYKTEIQDYAQKVIDYNKFLLEESTIIFNKMSFDDLPADISVELMAVVESFLN